MTGNRLALTDRDRRIIEEVSRFGVVTRDQLVRARIFTSKTRANERLKRLTDADYLRVRPHPLPVGGPRHVYCPGRLSTNGRKSISISNASSDFFISHQLGLVDIRLALEKDATVGRYLNDKDLDNLLLGLVPDAYAEAVIEGLTHCWFIEYDRGTETVGRFERKVRAYLTVAESGRFQKLFNRKFFRTLVVTDAVTRLSSLSKATAAVTDRIFRFTTLVELVNHGLLAPIWRKPGAERSEPLTGA